MDEERRSGAMRGLGCEAIVVLWIAIRSWKTLRTYGMCRSECRLWLVTYRGAFVIVVLVLDSEMCKEAAAA
jgi:hypothetical protein